MKYLPEFVYGSIDGIITTSAIISSTFGVLNRNAVIGVALANVFGDGFSMASSNYLSEKARLNDESHKNALVTFISFILIGMVPVIPLLMNLSSIWVYLITFTTMFLIGYLKGYVLEQNGIITGSQTLGIGFTASMIALMVARYTGKMI